MQLVVDANILLTVRIQIFPETAYQPFMKKALALGLMLKAAIGSNDKRLKEQAAVMVYSTHELLVMLQEMSG